MFLWPHSRSLILFILPLLCMIGFGCSDEQSTATPDPTSNSSVTVSSDDIDTMRKFCVHCHAFPPPQSFPREAWKAEVAQAYRFFHDSPTAGLEVPPEETTVAWFESQAPESLAVNIKSATAETDRFALTDRWSGDARNASAIACLRFDVESQQLWACDMQTGSIFSAQRGDPLAFVARPLEIVNPCRLTPVDLDGDGTKEILASELGSFLPQDHQQGGVWGFSPGKNWEGQPVLTSAGRVSDVQPADFDADGDVDLVVAEFGWRRTGKISILWKESDETWREMEIDKRHGAIDVSVVDLNGDNRPDVVALLSQEYETVTGYLNNGDGTFDTVSLYEAGDPSFGSSGIQVIDFDADGDYDILHTNGDNSDDGYVKPFHGIRWLENNGDLTFQVHELAAMPGAHRATAGDLDLDGDLDIVAVSLLPSAAARSASGRASIIWLEQTDNQIFVKHVVETDMMDHSSCELVDWDSDGDLDICVTHFRWNEEQGEPVSWFENLTNDAAPSAENVSPR